AHMVRQRDRLRLLQMRKSRHKSMYVLLHDGEQRLKELLYKFIELRDLVSYIELHVERDLVIAASARVQLLAHISDAVDEVGLHEAVNILIFTGDLKLAALHVQENAAESLQNLVSLLLCENALLCQHPHMRHAALDILSIKFLVKGNGRVEIVNQLVGFLGKASAP